MTAEKQCFYVVWSPEASPPMVKHKDWGSADKEATRLARQNRGQTFIVLKSVSEHVTCDVAVTRHSDFVEDRPF